MQSAMFLFSSFSFTKYFLLFSQNIFLSCSLFISEKTRTFLEFLKGNKAIDNGCSGITPFCLYENL